MNNLITILLIVSCFAIITDISGQTNVSNDNASELKQESDKIPDSLNTTNYCWGKGRIFEKFDKEKEIVSKRTMSAKHFKNDDDSYTAVIIAGLVHYKDEDGEWKEIDSKILEVKNDPNYKFCNKTNNFKSYFSANSTGNNGFKFSYKSIDLIYGQDISLSWSDSSGLEHSISGKMSVDGKAEDNKVIYKDCFDKIDIEFNVTSTGLSRDLIFKNNPDFLDDIPDGSFLNIVEKISIPDDCYILADGEHKTSGFITYKNVNIKDAQGNGIIINCPAINRNSDNKPAVYRKCCGSIKGRLQFKFIGDDLFCYTQIPVNYSGSLYSLKGIKTSTEFYPDEVYMWTGSFDVYENEYDCGINVWPPGWPEARGWAQFDVSSIDGQNVTDAILKLDLCNYDPGFTVYMDYYQMDCNPRQILAWPDVIWDDCQDGTQYCNNVLPNQYVPISDDLVGADEDIENEASGDGVFVVGFSTNTAGSDGVTMCGYGGGTKGTPSTLTITYDDLTPIELIFFNANCENKVVEINWQTASETNNDFFTILRSKDGKNWEIVTKVDGAGNSSTIQHYEFVDKVLSFGEDLGGALYYRLKQTDYNGEYTYSAIIVTQCEEGEYSFEFVDLIENNQNEGTITILFNSKGDEEYRLQLIDIYGHLLFSRKNISNYGLNAVKINTNDLTKGIYLIVLQNETKAITKKFMMQ